MPVLTAPVAGDALAHAATALLDDPDAAEGLAALAAAYRAELDAEAAAPRWKELSAQVRRLRAAAAAFRVAARDLAPDGLAFLGLAEGAAVLAPAGGAAAAAERLAVAAQARLDVHAAAFVRGGAKRPRRGPSARWRLILACAGLLDQRRPGSVSGTAGGPLHQLATAVHQAATGADEAGLAGPCGKLGKLWRDRSLTRAAAARLPEGDARRSELLAEAEDLTRALARGR